MGLGYGSVPGGGANTHPYEILDWAFSAHTAAISILNQYKDPVSGLSEKEKCYTIHFLMQAIFLYKKAGIALNNPGVQAFYREQMLLAHYQLDYLLGKEPKEEVDALGLTSGSDLEQRLGDGGGRLEQRLGDGHGL